MVTSIKGLQKLGVWTLAAVSLTLSACSTTSVVKVADGAPITYKVGEGAVKYASASTNLPRSSQLPSISQHTANAPSVAVPSPYVKPTAPQPRPKKSRPEVDNFDQKRIDKDLYKHQKVGNTYSMMGKKYTPKHNPKYDKKGLASWYGDKYHGKPTATGEIFNKNAFTAAHKTLPLNSMLHVTNLETGESIMVRLNDRGPFVDGRIIDLSEAAARELGVIHHGTARVRVRYAGPADPMAASQMAQSPSVATPMPYQPFVPQSAPQSAAIPQPMPAQPQQEYQPLRKYTPQNATPLEYEPAAPAQSDPRSAALPYSAPQYQPSTPQYMAPQAPVPMPPQPELNVGEDEVITLTIKGPIHMAKSNSVNDAKWINAVNSVDYPK